MTGICPPGDYGNGGFPHGHRMNRPASPPQVFKFDDQHCPADHPPHCPADHHPHCPADHPPHCPADHPPHCPADHPPHSPRSGGTYTVGRSPGSGGTYTVGQRSPGSGGTYTVGQGSPGYGGSCTVDQRSPGSGGTYTVGQRSPGSGGTYTVGQRSPGSGGNYTVGQGSPGSGGSCTVGQRSPGSGGTYTVGQRSPGSGGTYTVGQSPPGSGATYTVGQSPPGSGGTQTLSPPYTIGVCHNQTFTIEDESDPNQTFTVNNLHNTTFTVERNEDKKKAAVGGAGAAAIPADETPTGRFKGKGPKRGRNELPHSRSTTPSKSRHRCCSVEKTAHPPFKARPAPPRNRPPCPPLRSTTPQRDRSRPAPCRPQMPASAPAPAPAASRGTFAIPHVPTPTRGQLTSDRGSICGGNECDICADSMMASPRHAAIVRPPEHGPCFRGQPINNPSTPGDHRNYGDVPIWDQSRFMDLNDMCPDLTEGITDLDIGVTAPNFGTPVSTRTWYNDMKAYEKEEHLSQNASCCPEGGHGPQAASSPQGSWPLPGLDRLPEQYKDPELLQSLMDENNMTYEQLVDYLSNCQ